MKKVCVHVQKADWSAVRDSLREEILEGKSRQGGISQGKGSCLHS